MFNFNREKDDMFEEYYASKAESSTATEEVPKRFSPEEYQKERSEGEFDEYYSDKEPAKEKEIPMVPRRLHMATVCFYSIIMILLVIGNFFNSRHIKRVEEDLKLATEEVEFSRATIKAYEFRAERDEELIDSLQMELAVKELDSFLKNYDFSDPKPNPDPSPKLVPDPSPEPPSPNSSYSEKKSPLYDGVDIVPNDDSGPGTYVDDFIKTQPSSDGWHHSTLNPTFHIRVGFFMIG